MPRDELDAAGGTRRKQLRIRMYNVGFGDCLLFFVPTDRGERTILVDCGAHLSGNGQPMREITQDIVQAVSTDGRARIDVVVATHRHFDHISGFDRKIWDDVAVGEVWMPWTEKRGDQAADKLRHDQKRIARALVGRIGNAASPAGQLAFNSLSNAGAERTLLTGFAGKARRRYLPEGDDRTFTTGALPGVNIHVLGPSRDPRVIATMDPPKGQYFPEREGDRRGGGSGADDAEDGRATTTAPRHAFAAPYRVAPDEYAVAFPELALAATADALDERAKDDLFGAAASLEDAINGTSLVLVLEVDRTCVLLGGDAEWGTWSVILEDEEWRALLRRTSVYKVSHHGSYNGTPKPFVDDLLPDDALSLVSLCPIEQWPSIPRTTLIEALSAKSRRLVRTDQMPPAATDRPGDGTLWVEVAVDL